MPFLTPFGFRRPAVEVGIPDVNYYRFPLEHAVRYTDSGGASSTSVTFRGHVEVYESGTVRLDGWIRNSHTTLNATYRIWAGTSTTSGSLIDVLEVPFGNDWVPLDYAYKPASGETFMLTQGDTGETTGAKLFGLDCFSYSDGGWKSTIGYIVPWQDSANPPAANDGSVEGSLYRSGTSFHNDFDYDDDGADGTVGILVSLDHDSSNADPRLWSTANGTVHCNQTGDLLGQTTSRVTIDSADDGYFFYAQVSKSGINIARTQLSLGPFPRSTYAPSVQNQPDPGYVVSNYYAVPYYAQYYYRDTAVSGFDQIVFKGVVRVFESGTQQWIGHITTNDNGSTDRKYECWVGSSKTVGSWVEIGTGRHDGTTVPVNTVVIPAVGETIYTQFGPDRSKSGWVDVVEVLKYQADPWNLLMNLVGSNTNETSGNRISVDFTRNGNDIDLDYVNTTDGGNQGIIHAADQDGDDLDTTANFVTEYSSFGSGSGTVTRTISATAGWGLRVWVQSAVSGSNSIVGAGSVGPIKRTGEYSLSQGYDPSQPDP